MSRGRTGTGVVRTSFPFASGSAILLVFLHGLGQVQAGTCPVSLFREHGPTRPPGILSDAPLRDIFDTPYTDPDPRPPGVTLTYYRVNLQTTAVDLDYPIILLEKSGEDLAIFWAGSENARTCCVGTSCMDLCPEDCADAEGTELPDGVSCSDDPPPCGVASACPTASRPVIGMAKQAGGGVTFGGSGFPTLAPVELRSVDTDSGTSSASTLTSGEEEERVWNFTGAQDPTSGLLYHAGGRFNHGTIPATVVVMDVTRSTLVSAVPLSPPVNLVHVDFDNETGALYGLAAGPGNIQTSAGSIVFTGAISLVLIEPASGAVTELVTGLPAGLRNFSASLDGPGRRYFYHTLAGELHAVDLDDGSLTTIAVAEILTGLEADDATGMLYGLETWGGTTFTANGDDGYRTLGNIELVDIDEVSGDVSRLNMAALPTGTTNFSSAFDCEAGHFLYVSDTGETHVLDVMTGELLASAPPPGTARYHAFD